MYHIRKTLCWKCGKECFDRRSQAERVVYAQKKRSHHRKSGSVYLCKFCGKYLVTHYSYEESDQMKSYYRKRLYLQLVEI